MSVVPPEHFGPWTIDDLEAMPESYARIEIDEGSLIVTPPPAAGHQYLLSNLSSMLKVQLGEDYVVVENLGVDMETSFRIPDLLVFRAVDFDLRARRIDPSTLELVVEVVSPSTRSQDRLVKPAQYAAAGIPAFWRIETDPHLSLTACVLRDDVYAELGTWTTGETAAVWEPFVVDVEIDSLLPRHR